MTVLATSFLQDGDFIDALYILAAILFILGLRGLAVEVLEQEQHAPLLGVVDGALQPVEDASLGVGELGHATRVAGNTEADA